MKHIKSRGLVENSMQAYRDLAVAKVAEGLYNRVEEYGEFGRAELWQDSVKITVYPYEVVHWDPDWMQDEDYLQYSGLIRITPVVRAELSDEIQFLLDTDLTPPLIEFVTGFRVDVRLKVEDYNYDWVTRKVETYTVQVDPGWGVDEGFWDRVELDILEGLTDLTRFYPSEEAYDKFYDWYIENIK
jgi:hypothetical protein